VYQERLALGVAREQARKDLPLATYTEAYWKIDLHNLFHFLGLRLDPHAQLEIRTYAQAVLDLIEPLVPVSVEAFRDYRLNAMTLTALDIAYIRNQVKGRPTTLDGLGKREVDELDNKLSQLGF
jgi:thymidylate synthase (FAD)